ncbi:MAG: hypothetical protein K2M48_05060, partial [Clostridiales bacterium]|nr:hypothetical protein [Clostridiales bacterium]
MGSDVRSAYRKEALDTPRAASRTRLEVEMCALKIPRSTRYRKRVGRFAGLDVKNDESVVDFSTAAVCYNFDFSSGALRGGYGIVSHAAVPTDAKRYWVYRCYSETLGKMVDKYMFHSPSGLIRFYEPETGRIRVLSGVSFSDVKMLNYKLNSKDVILISCNERPLMTWDGGTIVRHDSAPRISSMALHYERLFVTNPDEPTKVFFSDDLDPTNWKVDSTAGGFIELLDERGDMTKVVSFGGYLYVFREHGISRITAAGAQSGFSAVNLFVSADRIYPESIVKCGSVIMFLASDGLYAFDGYDCTKLLTRLGGLIDGAPKSSAYFDGKYYLSCRMNFDDGKKIGSEASADDGADESNALLVYDVTTGEYAVTRGLAIEYMNSCTVDGEDMLVACERGGAGVIKRCGTRFDEPLPKLWRSPETDFGKPDCTKMLREVYVDTSVPCSVTVRGKRVKTKAVKSGRHRVRVNTSADAVALVLETAEADCVIRPPTVIYT